MSEVDGLLGSILYFLLWGANSSARDFGYTNIYELDHVRYNSNETSSKTLKYSESLGRFLVALVAYLLVSFLDSYNQFLDNLLCCVFSVCLVVCLCLLGRPNRSKFIHLLTCSVKFSDPTDRESKIEERERDLNLQ